MGAIFGLAYSSAVSFARPSDTNEYSANDIVGPSPAAALTFPNMGGEGGQGDIVITTIELEIDITSVPSGMTSFTLYLYNVTPPSAAADNAPWDLVSGDRASFLGYVSLGTPVDLGSTLYVQTVNVNRHLRLGGNANGNLFAYLVTAGDWTPASASVFKITLHAAGF